MGNTLKMQVDQLYDISPDDFAEQVGFQPNEIDSLLNFNYMAFSDGTLKIFSKIWADDENKPSDFEDKAVALIGLSFDGSIQVENLIDVTGTHFDSNWVSVGFDDGVMLISNTDKILYLDNQDSNQWVELEVENPIPKYKHSDISSSYFRIYSKAYLRATDNFLAIPISGGISPESLAFLSVELSSGKARWQTWPNEVKEKRGFISRLFGKSETNNTFQVTYDTMIKMDTETFSYHGQHRHHPYFNQAVFNNGSLFVFTMGHQPGPKWGYEGAALLEIGSRGEQKRKLFFEDYSLHYDQKKRGIEGFFTSCGSYCVLSQVYKTTDPWKGKQKLLNVYNQTLKEIEMPRGYTKYRLVDHSNGYFWFKSINSARGSSKIARCKVADT